MPVIRISGRHSLHVVLALPSFSTSKSGSGSAVVFIPEPWKAALAASVSRAPIDGISRFTLESFGDSTLSPDVIILVVLFSIMVLAGL